MICHYCANRDHDACVGCDCQHKTEGIPYFDLGQLPVWAARCEAQLEAAGFPGGREGQSRQTIALAEEVGEFLKYVRRYLGMARTAPGPDTFAKMREELADVVITSFVTAEVFGIDLHAEISQKLQVIFTRGWRAAPEGWACLHREVKPWHDGSDCPECPPGEGYNAPA